MIEPQMPTTTGWVLIGTIVFLLFWEIYVIIKGRETISAAIFRLANLSMGVTFFLGLAIGYLLGHFFW